MSASRTDRRRLLLRAAASLSLALVAPPLRAEAPNGHSPSTVPTAGFAPPRGTPIGGMFELRDQHDNPYRVGAPAHQPTLLFFGFTQCPTVCPTSLVEAKNVIDRAPAGRVPRVVFVTLDPERDTGDVLKAYVEHFDSRFVALRGTPGQINAVTDAYRVAYRRVPAGQFYTIDHSTYTYLLNETGEVERLYVHGTPAAVIASDIVRLPIARAPR